MKQTPDKEVKYSREVEEILHHKPSLLVRNGILILVIVFMALLTGSHFIRYPERLVATITFEHAAGDTTGPVSGQIMLTADAASLVQEGQPVTIVIAQTDGVSPGEFEGEIRAIQPVGSGDYYAVQVATPATIVPGTAGRATILTGESSLLSKILKPVIAVFSYD